MDASPSFVTIRDWVKKHKKTLFVSVFSVGAGYLCYQTLKPFFKRNAQEAEETTICHQFLLHQAEQRIDAQLKIHFQSIQRISDTTTLPSILPYLKSQLFSEIDLSGLTEKLTHVRDSPGSFTGEAKHELCENMKILCFTHATGAMCALIILVLFIRIQLNILARHVYIDTASTFEQSKQRKPLSKHCQQKYIAFSEFLPEKGIKFLIADMKASVMNVLDRITLKDTCSLVDLQAIFENIKGNFEKTQANWARYMLPEMKCDQAGSYATECDALEQLVSETRAIVGSQLFKDVFLESFAVVLGVVLMELRATFEREGAARLPLAKLLPPIAGIGVLMLERADENRFFDLITNQECLQSFCANVYSSFNQ